MLVGVMQAERDPQNVVSCFKRFMGLAFHDVSVCDVECVTTKVVNEGGRPVRLAPLHRFRLSACPASRGFWTALSLVISMFSG